MKRLTIMALGALALSGCTGTHISKPAVCDGKHRRPANLYGSILPTLPVPLPASQQQGGQSMVEPDPGSGPEALPAPPQAPALPPARTPAPPPSAGKMPVLPPASSPPSAVPPAPKTSQRDTALSYFSC